MLWRLLDKTAHKQPLHLQHLQSLIASLIDELLAELSLEEAFSSVSEEL